MLSYKYCNQAEIAKHVVSQTQRDIIFELRRIAFDGENDPTGTEKRKAMYTKDYKMLGFTVSIHCVIDLNKDMFLTLFLNMS